MTKRWGPNLRSEATKTKRSAAKKSRAAIGKDIERWLVEQGAIERITYDEDTGRPMRTFTIRTNK